MINSLSQELNNRLKEVISRLFEGYFEQNFKVLEIFYEQGMDEFIRLNESKII